MADPDSNTRDTSPGELKSRLATALVGLPLLWFTLQSGPPLLTALVSLVALLAYWELLELDDCPRVRKSLTCLIAALAVASLYVVHPIALIWVSCATSVVIVPLTLTSPQRLGNLPLWGAPYCAGLCCLGLLPSGWATLAVACTWMRDAGVYFLWLWLGGPRGYPARSSSSLRGWTTRAFASFPVSPHVSAHKYWGALPFGLLCSLATAALLGPLTQLSWWPRLLIGGVAGILGMLGDLTESALKRRSERKLPTVLPGHGSVLDRIDALLLVSPVIALLESAL